MKRSLLVTAEIQLGNDSQAYQQLQLMERLGASNNMMLLPSMIYSYSFLEQNEDASRLYAQFENMADDGVIFGEGSWAEVYFALGQYEKALAKVSHDPRLNSSDLLEIRNQFMELRNQIIFN